jgi:hypothetical protein
VGYVNVLVSVWRGDSNVAVFSVTDERFLEVFQRWVEWQSDYQITIRDRKLGPEHK